LCPELIKNHKQAASFFIPINGTSDIEAYTYLKSQGFVKNKDLEELSYEKIMEKRAAVQESIAKSQRSNPMGIWIF
jgi:hypothetical protein